jgi:hypothetical protein
MRCPQFNGAEDPVLACPTEKTPLRSGLSSLGVETRRWLENEQGVRYPVNMLYNDLLPSSADSGSRLTPDALRQELIDAWSSRTQTGLFRSPFTAFLYERGWRQGFANAGFPGIEKEYEEAIAFFEPAYGGIAVDMSCGSGCVNCRAVGCVELHLRVASGLFEAPLPHRRLMTRRLMSSEHFQRVLALDYSEAVRVCLSSTLKPMPANPLIRSDLQPRIPGVVGLADAD